MDQPKAPTAFVSYSWDDEQHKTWVRNLAARLRGEGVDVKLDQWDTVPGDQLPQFMERAIRNNEHVLIVCTPKYKVKSDGRLGGAGYEGDVMSGELFNTRNHRKFIPILRAGKWTTSLPTWMNGKYGVDLTGDPYSEDRYSDLLQTIHKQRPGAPPLGKNPFASTAAVAAQAVDSSTFLGWTPAPAAPSAGGPIRIKNIIVDEVTTPRMDGTKGSALYAIPLQLSSRPPDEWARILEATWDRPPQFTTMHRPGILRVEGDRVVLDGTHLEEFERYHRDTLKLVLRETNRKYDELVAKRRREEEQQRAREEQHKRDAEARARKITFEDF